MERLVKTYARRLIDAGLAMDNGRHQPLVGGWEEDIVWNRRGPEIPVLEQVLRDLSINSLVFVRPAPPYDRLIDYLVGHMPPDQTAITPKDCETRTFLHELPVVAHFGVRAITEALTNRKSVIVGNMPGQSTPAIIAHGTVSPEQGFVTVSSVCFACFVKFFGDYLDALRTDTAGPELKETFHSVVPLLPSISDRPPNLLRGPFQNETQVYRSITQTGRQTVAYGLVDSYFGNLSYCWKETLYISQTGSSLDHLEGCVDPVPLDGRTSAGMTASSELSAHLAVIDRTGCRAILHGHPKFAVILSMDCDPQRKANCPDARQCHLRCSRMRLVADTPIVPGEVGTGPHGLCHTLPGALEANIGAIVYGHGVFTTGRTDFQEAFETLLTVENRCREIYFERVRKLHRRTGR